MSTSLLYHGFCFTDLLVLVTEFNWTVFNINIKVLDRKAYRYYEL